MALNRFLREAVKQRMGIEFLIEHAVSDIPLPVMRLIKKEAFDKYLPNDRRPIKAWGLAMASLRCLKRDLVKNRNKQLAGGGVLHHHQNNQPQQHSTTLMTSNAFGLSQVEVVTSGGNEPMDTTSTTSTNSTSTLTTSSPIVVTTVKSSGRRGAVTIRELELNSRRLL